VRVNITPDEFKDRVLNSHAGTICMLVSYVRPGIRYDCLPKPALFIAPDISICKHN